MQASGSTPAHAYFDIHPRIVRADRAATITIEALYEHVHLSPDTTYTVTHVPCRGIGPHRCATVEACFSQGAITFDHHFAGEQEHIITVERLRPNQTKQHIGSFSIYSLEADLFAKRPLKGDFHMHSCRSDGKESPAYVAAACRGIGFDFMALTDHRQYDPSLEAQDAFADIEMDFKIFPGEEIHPPGSPVHIVNFGGNASVNASFGDGESYKALIFDYAKTLDDIPEGVDRHHYASSLWCFEKVREVGGLSIYCHPYWMTGHGYYVTEALNTALTNGQQYDAYELIGGFGKHEVDSNTLQVARYHEERANGRTIPIVGVSDAHGCERELFGWYYTIVFAETTDLQDIHDNIRACCSVAVEAVADETPRAYGPFRLVMYALFLLREFFPIHDDCCGPEGELMFDHIRGDRAAGGQIAARRGRVPGLYKKYWA